MTARSKSNDELAWWVALHSAENVGAATFHRLVKKFGSPEKVLTMASADTLQGVPGADGSLLDSIVFAAIRIDHTRKVIERLQERGVTVITFEDPDFPAPLKRLKWPPGVLYMMGDYEGSGAGRVGIVGATHPSARGFRTAYRSAVALAGRGYTIVSGNARGVDTAAHLGALDAGGRTIFVLPTGVLHFRTHAEMPPAQLERQAVILSERPPEAPWEMQGAITRNRITAALSEKLFIVEAAPDGGTMSTLHIARKLGVPVSVAVYRSDTPEGNLMALREGATEVKSVAELLSAVTSSREMPPAAQQAFDWI